MTLDELRFDGQGLIPAVVLPALHARLSPQKARLLALTGYSRSAEEALALGLCDRIAEDDQLASLLRRSIREMSRARLDAVATLKRHGTAIETMSFSAGIDRGVAETSAALARPEVLAAVRAFVGGAQ